MSAVTIPIAGGEAEGYLALPPGGSTGRGVLVLHAWWGLTPVFRAACDRLAAAGFVALAPDLFGGATATTIPEAQALAGGSDRAALRARAEGALAHLRGLPQTQGPQVGVVGFSLGGGWAGALAAAHPDAVGAVAIFYDDSDPPPGVAAPLIGHFGDADAFADPATIDALLARWRAVAPQVTGYRYPGAQHWFAEENQPGYFDPAATALAWSRTIAFLDATLAP